MNASPKRKLNRLNRTLATVVIVGVFYLNLAEILQVSCVQLSLPRPYVMYELFHMFTLWSSYTEWNSAYEAEAVVAGPHDGEQVPQWISIDVHQYLPPVYGDANRLMNLDDDFDANRPPDEDSPPKHAREYARIVEVLKRCHNRAHPEQPVDHLRLFFVWWPSSPLGYFHEYDQRARRLIYAQP